VFDRGAHSRDHSAFGIELSPWNVGSSYIASLAA